MRAYIRFIVLGWKDHDLVFAWIANIIVLTVWAWFIALLLGGAVNASAVGV